MADSQPGRLAIRIAQMLLVVAAAGLWAASRLSWVGLRTFDGLSPPKLVTLSGAQWSSGLLPLALLLLAAAIAALAVRGWVLRVLAVLVALASLATGYLAVSTLEIPDVAVRAADLVHVPLVELVGSNRHYAGPVITLVTAVCALAGAVLLMHAATTAGGVSAKYVTPGARRAVVRRKSNDETTMSERTMWDALDEGRDPTDQSDESASPSDDVSPREPDTEGR
ncbi:MAG: TIGR02234 family membrane protein [Mycobacterium sp.]